eukprot:CAMPEP_0183786424 /NCGR_PEP_ID=MMETSP0739-20130205/67020_1 /TAXON_ID=385413 /ORGANISM="Thalassiosira miniscula, Strain CCMP1093" /LENGTH=451 /DNA_ID=CAMNT_0026030475 /DNA_START=112 /DNA_END=1467 /DNA_ORIENTATION=+
MPKPHSKSPRSRRKVPTVSKRACASHRISTPFAFAGAFIVALAGIVGSEHELGYQLRASSGSHSDIVGPLLHLVRRLFDFKQHTLTNTKRAVLTEDQIDAYTRDGFLVVSGLLHENEVNSLVDAGENLISKHIEKAGGKVAAKGNFQVHEFGLVLNDKRFRDVALHSNLPLAAAELMQVDGDTQNLRVLRDVFLAKGHESTSSCGWHVDDQVFWPAAYKLPRPSQIDLSSVNAWIALDDMPIENGGSMAVSPASHREDFTWRSEALSALNFDDKFGNGIAKDDLFDMIKTGKVDSCGLEKVAPHVYDDIELSKQEFNFKRGDVIFMNRWLFHKSTEMTEQGKLALQSLQESFNNGEGAAAAMLKRYSVRFATGETSLPEGFMTEMSVLASDGLNLGKELDSVSGEWYPKCWPEVDNDVDEKLDLLTQNELPGAQQKLGAIMAEVMASFQSR